MSVFDRYGLNFDTARFGDADVLSGGASNTLSLVANTTPQFSQWQVTALEAGSPVRTDYFQNPTLNAVNSMISSATLIAANANTINASTLEASAASLIIELNAFKSHTDNISGVTASSNTFGFPSYDAAFGIGQQSMMILTKTDGPQQNTDAILGSFTSFFIQDILDANTIQLSTYAPLINVSTGNTDVIIDTVSAYCGNTANVLSTRRLADWSFYQNSLQVMRDMGFLQQFTQMGGTQTYLVKNLIGTPTLVNNLSANT
jgi:hypothetical protein